MRHALLMGSIALAVGAGFACSSNGGILDGTFEPPAPTTPAADAGAAPDTGEQGGVGVVDGGAGTGANTGLPCDVQAILEVRCIACHSTASPPPLLVYADLIAPSKSAPSKSMAQVSLERMKSTTSPMPPLPAVAPTPAEIAAFEAWVTASTPKGAACVTPVDAGAPVVDAGTNPYASAPICTSGKLWTSGNNGSMRPGEACQACHQVQGGPGYTVAGTVYPTAHEPKDCNGAPGPMTVVVTDKNAKVVNITTNADRKSVV
jgi:mono/diheme cytochrome c family protein